jgi:hypothetical protein
MADLTPEEQEAETARIADEAKTAEAEKEQTVKYSTYDKAMATAAKRKDENDELKTQLAELQKAQLATEKNIDPTKYQEVLESQLAESQQKFADLQVKFDTTIESRDKEDIDRQKLSAVWDVARKEGMVDDRSMLNFVDKDLVQLDENSVVSVKSVQTVVNKLKASKPFLFQQSTPEKINDTAPDGGDDSEISTLSFSEQLKRQQS